MSIQTCENGGFHTMKEKIMLTMLCAMVGVGAISGCGASSTNTVKEETPVADPTATPEP